MSIFGKFANKNGMQVFYAPDITGNTHGLDENESRHVVRVLRMKKGTQVKLIDGKGNLYEGVIEVPDSKKCIIAITGVINDFELRNYSLHIAISPLKNPDRFEWFVEKSVEIGVDEITPLICRNTEKPGLRADRISNVIVSAMKQSLKSTGTVLNDPVAFRDFINAPGRNIRMIAHCNQLYERVKIHDACSKGDDVLIMIGPEGDFSDDEIRSALSMGFKSVHLGRSRLRTETAGVAACHSVYFINQ